MCLHLVRTKHYSGDQTKKTEIGRACRTYGEMRGAYKVLEGNPKGRRPLVDNIKMDFREVGWGMDWIDLAEDRNR